MNVPIPSPSNNESSSEVWTVVVAGGDGNRFGARKQFLELAGESVLERSIAPAMSISHGVVVVVPAGAEDEAAGLTDAVVVCGGDSRSASVRAGLDAVPGSASIILIHDAARPLASLQLFERVIEAVAAGAEAVVPGIEVTDTIRLRSGGVLDRDTLVAVQTPQGFSAHTIRVGHASADQATDDATLVERTGVAVTVVEGEPHNIKITTAQDLSIASGWIEGMRG
jgi:2-C-methyl-D-erythritol 4-phosphate cytidylyltransferase